MRQAWREVRLLVPLLSVLCVLAPSTAAAQGTARSMDLDGSAISSGMGGASAAVFWSAEPNYWANPALLGYYRGVRYQYARSQLVPGLADDVRLTSHRVTLAAAGVGLEWGGTRLDYGTSSIVDESGNPVGRFHSREDVRSATVGLSLAGLVGSLAPESSVAWWAESFDLAVGFAQKDVEMDLAPGLKADASGRPSDVGGLLRAGTDFGGPVGGGIPVRVDAAFAAAVLNFNDVSFTFAGEPGEYPPSRMRRLGGALRLAIGLPRGRADAGRTRLVAALLKGLDPLLALGGAYDAEHVTAGDSDDQAYDVDHAGGEVAILNVFSVRFGHVTDRAGGIDGSTWGLGVGLPVAGVAGARYDYAEYPQSSSLPVVKRHTASVWVDPVAAWRSLRR
jgi:hypothetical protein